MTSCFYSQVLDVSGHKRPPTTEECQVIIKHLLRLNDRQAHEVNSREELTSILPIIFLLSFKSGGCFTNASSPKHSLKICVLQKSNFLWIFQAETLYVCPKHGFGHTYKLSAWNSHYKCDFWHCIFSRDYFRELANVSETTLRCLKWLSDVVLLLAPRLLAINFYMKIVVPSSTRSWEMLHAESVLKRHKYVFVFHFITRHHWWRLMKLGAGCWDSASQKTNSNSKFLLA